MEKEGEMKKLIRLLLVSALLVMLSCQSVLAPRIGMTRDHWLRRTLIADQVYLKDNLEVWQSGKKFYYFKDGKLDRIDQGQQMQQRFQIEIIDK